MSRTVTMLGFGDSARALMRAGTLHANIVGEVWTLNNAWECYGDTIKADRWFALHEDSEIESQYRGPTGFDPWTMLDNAGCDVIMQGVHPKVRRSRPYPFREVFKRFGSNYVSGSPGLMLALAIYEGVTHVRTWGFDLVDPQHVIQAPCWAWWCHEAMTRGVTFSGTALAFMSRVNVHEEGLCKIAATIGDELNGGK